MVLNFSLLSSLAPRRQVTFDEAVRSGSLSLVQQLHDSGQNERSVTACTAAACGGHLEALKWLRSQGYPWDASTFQQALQSRSVSHVSCLPISPDAHDLIKGCSYGPEGCCKHSCSDAGNDFCP